MSISPSPIGGGAETYAGKVDLIQRLPFLPVFSPLSPSYVLTLSDQDGVGNAMERTFEHWIGHPVVLQLALGRIILDVSGTILKDCGTTLLMKPESGPDVEIPRDYILKIERANRSMQPCIKFL